LESYGGGELRLRVTGLGGGKIDFITAQVGDEATAERLLWGDIEPGIVGVDPPA
jgi:hypothetical protein